MGIENLYIAPHIEITYSPETKILFCIWRGFQSKEGIQDAGELILSFIKEKKVTRVLNDNSKVQGPWHHTTEWTQTIWFPSVFAAGLKHFAWVLSENMFSSISAKKAMPESPIVRAFETYDEAHNWLLHLAP